MKSKNKKNPLFTVMILPHFYKKPLCFKISSKSLKLLLFLLLEIALVNFMFLFSYRNALSEVTQLRNYRQAYKKQKQETKILTQETLSLKKKVKKIDKLGQQLQKIIKLETKNNYRPRKYSLKTTRSINTYLREIEVVKERANLTEKSLQDIRKNLREREEILEVTPSVYPVNGKIISNFGPRHGRMHKGTDIKGNTGTPIRTTADGVVTFSGKKRGYGNCVMIKHTDKFSTLYGHNLENLVFTGEKVKKGQVIALLGSTGNATCPHLHYEVKINGRQINPVKFLNLNIKNVNKIGEEDLSKNVSKQETKN